MSTATFRHVVSVKGVCLQASRVLLLRNERDEWELPGGQLEQGEEPAACVAREVAEETALQVEVGPCISAWQYHILAGVDVLIVTFGCHLVSDVDPVLSHEHKEIGRFAERDVSDLPMPDGYKHAIATWYAWERGDVRASDAPSARLG